MPRSPKTARTCPKGHRYYKSSACPVCPLCAAATQETLFYSLLPAPARRALQSQQIRTEADLAAYSETAVLSWHGIGPRSLPLLRDALAQKGLHFKKD